MICVVAWTQEVQVRIEDWETLRVDLGERGTFRTETIARAAVWLNEATPLDVQAAQRWADRRDVKTCAFTFPLTEEDPLARGKAAILELVSA